jgi:hypothetical protein
MHAQLLMSTIEKNEKSPPLDVQKCHQGLAIEIRHEYLPANNHMLKLHEEGATTGPIRLFDTSRLRFSPMEVHSQPSGL